MKPIGVTAPPVGLPLGIVADDLTGALDAAGPFALRGWPVIVPLQEGGTRGREAGIVAVSAESRLLPAAQAAARTTAAARHLAPATLFKKMDSLLRGPFAAEIAALVEERRPDLAVVAPAFPAQRRTTIDAVQYAHGRPVHRLDARDPFAPASGADLRAALGARRMAAGHLSLASVRAGREAVTAALASAGAGGTRVIVSDAAEQRDLDLLAEAGVALGVDVLWCGTAGLAAALAATLPRRPQRTLPRAERALVVCGSLHETSAGQCAHLTGQQAVTAVTLDAGLDENPAAMASRIRRALAQSACILWVVQGCAGTASHDDRAALLGAVEETMRRLRDGPSFGLVATGGDTAAAVCRGLGVEALEVLGAVADGIPCSIGRGGPLDGAPIVTKAGAFGTATALWDAACYITKRTPG